MAQIRVALPALDYHLEKAMISLVLILGVHQAQLQ
jgi:hypothetical protein